MMDIFKAAKEGDLATLSLIAAFLMRGTYSSKECLSWHGRCAVCDLKSGKRFWLRSFDSQVTGDARSFHEAFGQRQIVGGILFLNSNELICNAAYDAIIVLDAFTGEETRRIPLGHNYGVRSFALDRQRKRLWTVSAQSELHVYDV